MVAKRSGPTDSVIDRIVECVRLGLSKKDAALHLGISTESLNAWLRRGGVERRHIDSGKKPRKRESAFLKLLLAYEKATSDFQLDRLRLIDGAAREGAWQAAAWTLERRLPEQWGKQRLDIQANGSLIVEGCGWLDRRIEAGKGRTDGDG